MTIPHQRSLVRRAVTQWRAVWGPGERFCDVLEVSLDIITCNDAALMLMNAAPDSLAIAFASSVLPVPGGPYSRMPC